VVLFGLALALVVAAVLCGFVVKLVLQTLPFAVPWDSYSVVLFSAYWIFSILLVAGVSRRGLRATAMDDACWWSGIGYSLVGCLVAVTAPGLSHFFLIPTIGTAIIRVMPIRVPWRISGSIIISGIILVPSVRLLDQAVRVVAPQVLIPLHVVVLLPLLPLFCGYAERDGILANSATRDR